MEILAAAAALLLLSFIFYLTYRSSSPSTRTPEREKLPPSPPGLPFIGNLHQIGDKPHRSLHALAQKHGPLMLLHLGCTPAIIVSSPDAAEELLITQGLAFSSRPTATVTRRLFYNRRDVIFAPQGEYWWEARKLCVLHLLSATKVQSFRAVREEEVSLLLDRIADGTVNLSQLLNSFTSTLIRRIAFGNKYSSASGDLLCRLAAETMVLLGNLSVRDCLPSIGWWAKLSGADAKVERLFRSWDAFLDEVIHDHEDGAGDEDDDNLVATLLSLMREEGEGEGGGESESDGFSLTKDDIKAILKDMCAAGTDTTFIAMEWTMAELVRNPAAMKKVQDEVRGAAAGKAGLDEDDVSRLVYLKATIKEALRLHPPVPLLMRESIVDARVKGYHVPAGTRVIVSCWSMGRDPKFWEDPEEFRPERFLGLGSEIDFRGRHPHLIPFGAGRRICAGMQYAASVVELVLANLMLRFDWDVVRPDGSGDLDMAEVFGLTMRMKSHLLLRATRPTAPSHMAA